MDSAETCGTKGESWLIGWLHARLEVDNGWCKRRGGDDVTFFIRKNLVSIFTAERKRQESFLVGRS
jgi:hypothetical protein